MGFTSQDDLINQITSNGKTDTCIMQKTLNAAGMAGAWQILAPHVGWPAASLFTGTDLTWVDTDDTWAEGVIWHGGDVSQQQSISFRLVRVVSPPQARRGSSWPSTWLGSFR